MQRVDVALVGGGLANGLLALRLASARPGLAIAVVERGTELFGTHTWSFHDTDLDPADRAWLAPLVRARWAGHDVAFPGRRRALGGGYASVDAGGLRAAVRALPGVRAWTGRAAVAVEPGRVRLDDGTVLEAACVIDGTGWVGPPGLALGWQTFTGRDLTLAAPHGLARPVLMDATVPQEGGYRFFYLLPWSATQLLVEETRYQDTPAQDPAAAGRAIEAYVAARGWEVRSVDREERGALPIVLAGRFEALAAAWTPGVATVGVKAGLFHATTGYSLPFAARLAGAVAALPRLETAPVAALAREHARRAWGGQRFFRFLNRMLFRAARPERRVQVFERFYGLGEGLIGRFYAAQLGPLDRARLLAGRPPVPVLSALRCLPERVAGAA
jgi:lycopene beta-cyclase